MTAIIKDRIKKILSERKFDDSLPYPQRQVCITVREKIVGVVGSYVAITGLPKAGKSTFLTSLIASGFIPGDIYNIKLNLQNKKLAWFDTESSDYDWYRHIDRVKGYAGSLSHLPRSIDAFNVREDEPATIKELINEYLENNDCGCLIIDSILDIIEDFNDPKESKRLTQWLKKITKKKGMCCVTIMHQSKSNFSTIGHLGASVDRYANSVIDISKDQESQVITMRAKMMRSDADFSPVAIRWGDRGYTEVDPENWKPKQTATVKKISFVKQA